MSKIKTPVVKFLGSGQVEIIGPRGGHTGQKITTTKGNSLPSTPKLGQGYILVDGTKNKSGF